MRAAIVAAAGVLALLMAESAHAQNCMYVDPGCPSICDAQYQACMRAPSATARCDQAANACRARCERRCTPPPPNAQNPR